MLQNSNTDTNRRVGSVIGSKGRNFILKFDAFDVSPEDSFKPSWMRQWAQHKEIPEGGSEITMELYNQVEGTKSSAKEVLYPSGN
jgi:hypothetical protein